VNIVGHFAARASLALIVAVVSITCANAQAQVVPPSSSAAGGSTYQQAVLHEMDPADPGNKKRKYTGRVLWQRTEAETDAKGTKNRAIRADIDIPGAKLRAQLTIRLNNDAALRASHTIEIRFQPQPGFEGGSISIVPGVMMKPTEEAHGTAFAAVPSRIGENHFLIGLSNTETDRRSNLQLLSKQPWFDIPAKYADNRPALLALEKGTTGDAVFAAALTEWAGAQRQ
jgi:hypothetical protein